MSIIKNPFFWVSVVLLGLLGWMYFNAKQNSKDKDKEIESKQKEIDALKLLAIKVPPNPG